MARPIKVVAASAEVRTELERRAKAIDERTSRSLPGARSFCCVWTV